MGQMSEEVKTAIKEKQTGTMELLKAALSRIGIPCENDKIYSWSHDLTAKDFVNDPTKLKVGPLRLSVEHRHPRWQNASSEDPMVLKLSDVSYHVKTRSWNLPKDYNVLAGKIAELYKEAEVALTAKKQRQNLADQAREFAAKTCAELAAKFGVPNHYSIEPGLTFENGDPTHIVIKLTKRFTPEQAEKLITFLKTL